MIRKRCPRLVLVVITRKDFLSLAGLAVVALVACGVLARTAIPAVGRGLGLSRSAVILDAGHGGVDPGTQANGVTEKEITLDIVLRMRDQLRTYGIAVELTRDTDRDVSGWERYRKGRHMTDIRNRIQILNSGTIGVSIHVNASESSQVQGALVFYSRGDEKGKALADSVFTQLARVQTMNHPSPIPRSNILILKGARVPVILVEVGFATNSEDAAKLKDPGFRERLAQAVGWGIIQYLTGTSEPRDFGAHSIQGLVAQSSGNFFLNLSRSNSETSQ